jgi:hypothetical protein
MRIQVPAEFTDRQWFFLSVVIGAAFFVLYACTAATTVQGLDCGEFVTVAAQGGVAHPPGYPLYLFFARLLNILVPFGTPVFKTALASSFCAAGALALLSLACFLLTKQVFAGIFSSLLLGLSLLFRYYATVPEVFAGNAFCAAAAIAVTVYISTRDRYSFTAFFLLGLSLAFGIANHQTVVLIFPVYCYALWRLARSSGPVRKKTVAGAGFFCAASLGVLSYGILLVPAAGGWRWGAVSNTADLVHHFLRADYGSFRLRANSDVLYFRENTVAFFQSIPDQFGYFFAALGVSGLLYSFFRFRRFRPLLSVLLACFVACGPLFVLIFNVPPVDIGKHVVERFYVLPMTILSFLLAVGAGMLVSGLRSFRLRTIVQTGIILFALAASSFSQPQSRSTFLEDYVDNCLVFCKPNAIIIGGSDSELGGFLYVQLVLGKRPDVVFVAPPLLQNAWYRSFLKTRDTGFFVSDTGAQSADLRTRIIGIVRDNCRRPVYLTPTYWKDSLLLQSVGTVVPAGTVLLETGQDSGADLDTVEKELGACSARLALRTIPGSGKEAALNVDYDAYLNYARTYLFMATLYHRAGNTMKQEMCDTRARMLARPWLVRGK